MRATAIIETVAGLWCASLGFSASERIARVAYDQMRKLGYYHTYRHRAHEASIDLAEKLIQIAPVPMSKVLFQCSGSEANDTAIKLAWYYQAAMGRPQKNKIIGRRNGYHGNTDRRRERLRQAGHARRLQPALADDAAHRVPPLLPQRARRVRARRRLRRAWQTHSTS